MAKRVTITDVARETGVSIKTVSNVLNNTGSMRPETRQRVQDAIERLGYRVNVSARAMKTGGTKLIGLAITDFCQPFMPYLADSIVAAARSRGYAVITDTYNSAGGLAQAIPETKKLAADGWIFFMGSPITDRTILHQPYPLVIVGDYDTQGLADWVTMPNVEAVRTAVGALLDSGCRRIALIGGTAENACPDADRESRPETTSTMRTRGYVLAHEERGLQVDWRLVRNADWVQSGGRDAVALEGLDDRVLRVDADQHDHEQEEHQDGAGVDDDLHHEQERGVLRRVQHGDGDHHAGHGDGRVDRLAREEESEGAEHRERRAHPEGHLTGGNQRDQRDHLAAPEVEAVRVSGWPVAGRPRK